MVSRGQFRASARRSINVPVLIRTEEDRTDRRAILVDLGLSGASLELGEALVPGVEVTLEIRTPTLWDPLQLPGHVAWAQWNASSGVARIGIRFEHNSPPRLFSLFELLCSQEYDN